MKLYYVPGACSLAAHIILKETGTTYSLEKVDIATKTTETGQNFWHINPTGTVPVIEISPGVVLSQASAILQYIGDHGPVDAFRPSYGSLERARLQEALGFCSDLHVAFGSLFLPDLSDSARNRIIARIHERAGQFETLLTGDHPFWLGEAFTQADAYAFVVMNWARFKRVDLSQYTKICALRDRVGARSSVQAALVEEGLHP